MPIEKQNNLFRERLEKLADIPGDFQFHTEKVWQQMEARLQPRRKSKKIFWLATAASIALLIALGPLFTVKSKTITADVKIIREKKETQQINDPTNRVNRVRLNEPMVIINSKNAKKIALNKLKPPDIKAQQLSIDNSTADFSLATIEQLPVAGIDSSNVQKIEVTIARPVAPANPRFKIAHINELYYSPSPEPAKTVKSNMVFSFKSNPFKAIYEDQPSGDDEPVVPQKPKTFLSLISSSQ